MAPRNRKTIRELARRRAKLARIKPPAKFNINVSHNCHAELRCVSRKIRDIARDYFQQAKFHQVDILYVCLYKLFILKAM